MNLAFGKHVFALGLGVEYGPGVHERIGEIAAEWGVNKSHVRNRPQPGPGWDRKDGIRSIRDTRHPRRDVRPGAERTD